MRLFPAIDIRGGRAVRLLQGDYDRETSYDADPLDAALRWVEGGADILHVVDLDGARSGRPGNLDVVRRITSEAGVPVQMGGGLRDEKAVEDAIAAGVSRAVLGTSAVRDPDLMGALCERFGGERLVASVDARGSEVAVEGWEQGSGTAVEDAIAALGGRGVRHFVYTPVEVDGTLEGPGLDRLDSILAACGRCDSSLIYSGGVGTLADLGAIAALGDPRIEGVIVGRALYERRFTIADAISALEPAAAGTEVS